VISRNSINGTFPIKRLGAVVEFLDSQRRPVTESDRLAGPYPYYGANGQQGTISDFIFDEPLVLLAEDGGHFGEPERGIAYRISGKTWVNNHAHVLRPKPSIELAYLCRVLENYDVTPFVTGTTRGKLTKAGASEIVIPLPPLLEQRRIADVLDRAEALRAKRRAALAELDELTQSIFLDMFGDPVFSERGWSTQRLETVAAQEKYSIVDGPFGSSIKPDDYRESGIPVVRITNITRNGLFQDRNLLFIERHQFLRLKRSSIRANDVLVSRVGTIGNTCIFPSYVGDALLSTTGVCKITLDDSKMLPCFLHAALRMPTFQEQIHKSASTSVQKYFNLSALKNWQIVVPPLALQREFAARVAAVERVKAAQRASLVELDELFAALQHRAFRGEL